MSPSENAVTFPCVYRVKIVCHQHCFDLDDLITSANRYGQLTHHQLTPSKTGRYISLSVDIYFDVVTALEAFYQEIKQRDYVQLVF